MSDPRRESRFLAPRPALPRGPELYAITNRELSALSHSDQAGQLLAGGARIIQLREKHAPSRELLKEVLRIRELTTAHGALFIINDDVELALACGADGLHIGQDDGDPRHIRDCIGDTMLLGISTHNYAQVDAAITMPVDSISVGPVFGTRTKQNPDPVTGLNLLREASFISPVPIVAIGGITIHNAQEVLAAAPRAMLCVISAIISSPDIATAVREFRTHIAAGSNP